MLNADRSLSITIKDMKEWFRRPFLIFIAIAPILVISLVLGVFMTQAEVLPAGLIIQDDDPIAIDLKNYIIGMESGSGQKWFEITETNLENQDLVLDKFDSGEILAYIIIPNNITARIAGGEIVPVLTHIHNIQDDITKNVMQRMEHACNHINRQLSPTSAIHTPKVDFDTIAETDVSFRDYVLAAVCALAVLLPAGANMATSNAQEFEKGTIKELVMGASPKDIVMGKLISTTIQASFGFVMILLFQIIVYQFIPKGNIFLIFAIVIWGSLCFSGIGFIISTRLKQLIPSAIAVMMINIIGWWIGGGLIPPEIWSPGLRAVSIAWPGTYFFRSFITLLLIGKVSTTLLLTDMAIIGIFGLITHLISYNIFSKEAVS